MVAVSSFFPRPRKVLRNVDITAPGKLIVLCIVIVGCFAYIVASLFVDSPADTTPAWALLTLAVGVLWGNGSGARKGVTTVAPFSPTAERQIERLESQIRERDG